MYLTKEYVAQPSAQLLRVLNVTAHEELHDGQRLLVDGDAQSFERIAVRVVPQQLEQPAASLVDRRNDVGRCGVVRKWRADDRKIEPTAESSAVRVDEARRGAREGDGLRPARRHRGALGAAAAGGGGYRQWQRSGRTPILFVENLALADELLNASAAVAAGDVIRAHARASVASSVWKLVSSRSSASGVYTRMRADAESCCSNGGDPSTTRRSGTGGCSTRGKRSRSASARASLVPSKKRAQSRTSRSESG